MHNVRIKSIVNDDNIIVVQFYLYCLLIINQIRTDAIDRMHFYDKKLGVIFTVIYIS